MNGSSSSSIARALPFGLLICSLFYRLEMNSSLEQDYDEFKFSRENQLEETDVEENLQNFSEFFFNLSFNLSNSLIFICFFLFFFSFPYHQSIGTSSFSISHSFARAHARTFSLSTVQPSASPPPASSITSYHTMSCNIFEYLESIPYLHSKRIPSCSQPTNFQFNKSKAFVFQT
jgi:hypothetical protein